MRFDRFDVANLPRIVFGEGSVDRLPELIGDFGRRVLLVTGLRSFRGTEQWAQTLEGLKRLGIEWEKMTVEGEPSPQMVDEAVARFRDEGVDVVVGIGGGSTLDAAKAIAGLLPVGNSVMDYLEDVGQGLPYRGRPLPFIAVPTTAGTGSEATKNAVLSVRGEAGFKKSFRHESLIARVALVDPQLLRECPPRLIAAQGMDAFTQLLESYVSVRANPFTDGLALSGLKAVAGGFFDAWTGGDGEAARQGRAAMSYAALLSGITLAHVGLGSVHGLAQPLGSLFPIPHGVACGTTVAEATAVNISALKERGDPHRALEKYAEVSRLLGAHAADRDSACAELVEILRGWTERLELPRLSDYGVAERNIAAIVADARGNSMKTNPVELTDEEIAEIVRRRL
jgi:alcohol dehydrogenase class IV